MIDSFFGKQLSNCVVLASIVTLASLATDAVPPNGPPTCAGRSRYCVAGDLLRQLVPGPWSASSFTAALEQPEAMIASATTVHDPHPNRLPVPDHYSIEDANADFFD